jgi:aspartate/methionine/tyrosine aminotransferase
MALKTSRRAGIDPFIVMDVMRAANRRQAEGGAVIHLEVGQPSTGAPSAVVAAAKRALDDDRLGYTDAFGLSALRSRIARHYEETYGVSVDAERVVTTTGSSGAFIIAFLAAFDAGDRVALASPGYPAYRNILSALDVEPVPLLVGPETNFQPTPEVLDGVDGRLDGLIIASPSNPTGTMIDGPSLERLVAYCRRRGIRLVSDEIYHGITYEAPAQTALAFGDEAIIINSFSKYYSMTGWRLGWMVVPDDMLRPVECLAQNLFVSPPTLPQHAAIAAFDCGSELDGHVARYRRNRDILMTELPKAGFDRMAPAEGAFYLYADVSQLTNDSQEFCRRMLAETGVAATPGVDFDPDRGSRFVRFSIAGSSDEMIEAARLLIDWRR